MKPTALLAGMLMFLYGCSRPAQQNSPASRAKDTIAAVTPTPVPNSAGTDSLDKANAAMVNEDPDYRNKLTATLPDSLLYLTANMRLDHRIFGYEQPDKASRRMLLLSIFTNDVAGNPFRCPLGAYYDTSGLGDTTIQYLGEAGAFIRAKVIRPGREGQIIYFERQWVSVE